LEFVEYERFYEFYILADEKVRQLVALLPWKHNVLNYYQNTVILRTLYPKTYRNNETICYSSPKKDIKEMINREIEEFYPQISKDKNI